AGRSAIRLDGQQVGLLQVPRAPARRLVVLLHGAGGSAAHALGLLAGHAETQGLVLFAPQAVAPSWDVITRGYGVDVARIQRAMDQIAAAVPMAGPPPAIGGFSDGASYALSLGLANGDVFAAVLAFSPGFVAPAPPVGDPECFVSHGRADTVLPVDRCSRRIVPALRRAGYHVRYDEFDGGHEVPGVVVADALDWLAARDAER
ncbi:MAG TPA: hypothetical protein VES42_24195, partial [Pilimelia sp.]|nr:hypothetical protein [Pilimelia sp.]